MEADLERQTLRIVNSLLTPLILRGFASPCLAPLGLVALEHTGRKSGRTHTSPLVALRMGGKFVVATFRTERSHWIRNLKAEPLAALWIHGRRREMRAEVHETEALWFSVLEPA